MPTHAVILKLPLKLMRVFTFFLVEPELTGAIKKFQELMGIYIPPRTLKRFTCKPENLPVVFVGPYEHHSNELSFREGLCEVIRCTIR